MATKRNIRYSPLSIDDDDYNSGGTYDARFDYSPKAFDRVPWRSVALALFLLSLGSVLLFLSFFILAGHMGGEKPQAYGLLTLGILSFLPGFYETRIAYYSWRGANGYRFSSIPDWLEVKVNSKLILRQSLIMLKEEVIVKIPSEWKPAGIMCVKLGEQPKEAESLNKKVSDV